MGKLGLTQAKDSLKVTQPRVKIQIRVPEPVFLVVTLGCLPGWSSLGPLPSSLGGLRGAGGHGEAGRGQEEDRRPPRQSPYMQGLSGRPPKRDFSPGFGCIAPRPTVPLVKLQIGFPVAQNRATSSGISLGRGQVEGWYRQPQDAAFAEVPMAMRSRLCRQPAGRVLQGRDSRFWGRKTPV